MNEHFSSTRAIMFAGLLFGPIFVPTAFSACDPLLPNLRPLPASDIQLVLDSAGQPLELRFGATNWNSGWGRLELVAKSIDTNGQKRHVDQRIYDTCGTFQDRAAGDFVWHPNHNHFHFERFANYFLTPVGNTSQGRNGSKTTFCIMDTTSINPQLWSASGQTFSTCGNTIQGMSVGWGDTYGSHLDGQSIDARALAPGDYTLEINVDPFDKIEETNETDNWSCVLLRFVGSQYATSFNLMQRRSGRCSDPPVNVSVDAISPAGAAPGWTGTVTITGSGFDPVMPLSISGASLTVTVTNVAYLDSTTIEATVKVPKKRRVRDAALDVTVGSPFSYTGQGIMSGGFAITSP